MVSKKKFDSYCRIQASGVCNMWSKEVEYYGDLTNEEHCDIIRNYDKYVDMYGDLCSEYEEKFNDLYYK